MNLVIFDVDGTLLDNLASEDVCYAAALRVGLGITALDTDWRTYAHVSDEGVAREAYHRAFGTQPTPEVIAQTMEHFVTLLADAHAREPFRPIAGAAALLSALSARGWASALATGAWLRAARLKLAAAGLRVEHLPLATAEDGPARVDIVRAAWARAATGNRAFDRVVLVGDGIWDVATAEALELPFVGRANGGHAAELRARGAVVVVADFTQVDGVFIALETASVPRGAAS